MQGGGGGERVQYHDLRCAGVCWGRGWGGGEGGRGCVGGAGEERVRSLAMCCARGYTIKVGIDCCSTMT